MKLKLVAQAATQAEVSSEEDNQPIIL